MKPVSKTAFYCSGYRMLDADSDNPVCDDKFAKLFVEKEGFDVIHRFRKMKKQNRSNVCRHRIIDDLLKREFEKNPETTVILVGAGFDTRAYRMDCGSWIEFDEKEIIDYKNKKLPVEDCKNRLIRIAVNIEDKTLVDKIDTDLIKGPVIVILEGVSVYIKEKNMVALVEKLKNLSGHHMLICDLQTHRFYKLFNRKFEKIVNSLGAEFFIHSNTPEKVFLQNGYSFVKRISIVEQAVELGAVWIPKIFLKTIFANLKFGYSVFVFTI